MPEAGEAVHSGPTGTRHQTDDRGSIQATNGLHGRRRWHVGTIQRRCDSPSRVKDSMRPSRSPLPRARARSSEPGDRLVITDLPITCRPLFEPSEDSVLNPQIVWNAAGVPWNVPK